MFLPQSLYFFARWMVHGFWMAANPRQFPVEPCDFQMLLLSECLEIKCLERLPSATGEIDLARKSGLYNYLQAAKSLPISFKNMWALRARNSFSSPLFVVWQISNEYIESNRWLWEESRTSYFLEGPGRIRRTGFSFQHFHVKRTSAKEMHAACLQVIDASLDLELPLIHLFPDDLTWPSCGRHLMSLGIVLRLFHAVPVLKFYEILHSEILRDLLASLQIFEDLLRSFRNFWYPFESVGGSFWIFLDLWGNWDSGIQTC